MPLVYNGVTVTNIIYNGVSLDKVVYNGITGFSKGFSYVFSANTSNVNFATLIGATNVNNNTTFNITINAGVTLSGSNGSDAYSDGGGCSCWMQGGYDEYGNYTGDVCCPGYDIPGNYYPATNGLPAIDFSGMSGKTINIINNGTIRGGNGGVGGGLGALALNYSH